MYYCYKKMCLLSKIANYDQNKSCFTEKHGTFLIRWLNCIYLQIYSNLCHANFLSSRILVFSRIGLYPFCNIRIEKLGQHWL